MSTMNRADDPADILLWRRIDGRLTTSGQPNEAQLAELAELGVSHIVNLGLHSHEKALPDEAAAVGALGMRYIHIPVDFDDPTEADLDRFRQVMRDLQKETIHIHCIANLRVSAFLYRYRRDDLAMPEVEARTDLDALWRPGGVWADFIGDATSRDRPHVYARRDYAFPTE